MKKLLFAGLMSLMVFVSQAQFTKAELQATGLTCAMCNNAINKALQALPFIQPVKSNIKNSSFLIVFKEGQEPSPDAIKQAVEDAGFSVGRLELWGETNPLELSADKHLSIGKSAFHFVGPDNKTLTPDTRVQVVDKGFLSMKQFKKISSASKMACVQTGKAASCCADAGVPEQTRIYHITI